MAGALPTVATEERASNSGLQRQAGLLQEILVSDLAPPESKIGVFPAERTTLFIGSAGLMAGSLCSLGYWCCRPESYSGDFNLTQTAPGSLANRAA